MTDKIAVLGAGMIGGSITRSLIKGGYKGITVTDCSPEKVREMKELGAYAISDNRKAAAGADVIFICVKPGDVEKLLKEISAEIKGKLVISTAAALPLCYLKKIVPHAKFIRIMPNMAILVQASYTAFCCVEEITVKEKEKITCLLNLMGLSKEIDEKHMDAITGLSGSGPGYLAVVAEAMVYGGLKVGLPKDVALNASAQTLLGTAKLILDLQENPAKIRDMVTTPGGTTIEAIYALEEGQVRQAIMKAIEEATKKSRVIRERLCNSTQ